jgi:hypothetical protein
MRSAATRAQALRPLFHPFAKPLSSQPTRDLAPASDF